ncbi:MAG: hypothetical protein RQ745_08135 [Longimicrobiales bacterium]|nr:hypothetical protein [Longimicrobiales bacterium]
MSRVRVVEARTRRERKAWVRFVFDHYRDHPRAVPQLLHDEIAYFDPKRNPAWEVCEIRLLLALDGDRPVGRVAAILNHRETERVGHRVGRFGWFETIDDPGVAHALLDTAKEWLDELGCMEFIGPYGFTDLDPSGILIEGHDQIPTVAGSYHPPYYPKLLEEYGFEKLVDYLEFRMDISEPVPFLERLRDRAGIDGYRVVSPSSRGELKRRAPDFWDLLEREYAHLTGVVPLTPEQTEFYTRKYLSFLDPRFVKLGFDEEDTLVGFFVGMPNLSRAFRKTGGRLLPFGFWHILRAYRRPDTVDLLLAAVSSDAPTDRFTLWGFIEIVDAMRARGVRYLEANRQLETNTRVHRLWRKFNVIGERRTRIYRMPLG